jgi:hypothetical protein
VDSGPQLGFELFNSGRFFEAHEALEDVWRLAAVNGSLRRHLQGFVQLAVAFHHHSTGNFVGARSVLERARRNLSGAEESFPEFDFETLHASVTSWCEYLANDHSPVQRTPPALPKLMLRVGPAGSSWVALLKSGK